MLFPKLLLFVGLVSKLNGSLQFILVIIQSVTFKENYFNIR